MPFAHAPWNIRWIVPAGMAMTGLTGGCGLCPTHSNQGVQTVPSDPVAVVRQGRYALTEILATDAQQDLMRQIVNIELPSTKDATLGDALHVLLLRSGYRLCTGHDTQDLAALPLPAVHNPLGPLTLRDALDVLAGRGWQVEVDESIREVCFGRRP